MPPKRKAGPAAAGQRAAKRSGAATPQTIGSSDEFGEEEASETEAEDLSKAINTFSIKKGLGSSKFNSGFLRQNDFSTLPLKPDHTNRPLWIDPDDGKIIVESFSPVFKQAQDFLIAVAEPQSRPQLMHEYILTAHSLYAAVSVGLEPEHIISVLDRFSKTPLPKTIKDFITNLTGHYGKVKLVLKHNKYFLESSDVQTLQKLLRDPTIASARIAGSDDFTKENAPKLDGLVIPGTKDAAGVSQNPMHEQPGRPNFQNQSTQDDQFVTLLEDDDDDYDETEQVHSFQIMEENVEMIQKRCLEMQYPLLQEYDFRNDQVNANLEIDLRPSTKVRDYQEQCLSKMFGNGRAKSGIIVLPCGAGKTLVGICAAVTVKKGVIILCTSSMSVVQWRNEFLKWSNINPVDIAILTADHKDKFPGATGIIISTYSMITQTRSRAHDTQEMMNFIQGREWGLMILDEVHVVPASIFRKVTHSVATHTKLGLTATLLREDDKIKDLNFLIGPKLFEANWMELAQKGHIARVQCAEVWCPMTAEFMLEYLNTGSRKQGLLYTMNPRKFQACQFLIDYHEKRGDKIIVFSDNVYALKQYALKLNKAYIFGGTGQAERLQILENFQHNPNINTIFLSKIGDTSLDLPEATCLIQISSHYGSRRQEAQRLGRILRAKRRNDEGFNAFFYSLVSKDTTEMLYSSKRQAFLVDQGYAFKVITHLEGAERFPGLAYASASERRELLQEVMLQNETSAEIEHIDGDLFGEPRKRPVARRTANTLAEHSGGQDMAYVEYKKSKNKELKGKSAGSKFLKTMRNDQAKRKKANTGGV